MDTKLFVMAQENMQEMKMEMVFVRYIVIHKKEFDGPLLRSLMRSWLRPHRGVSQEKLPFYVGFFDGAVLTVDL